MQNTEFLFLAKSIYYLSYLTFFILFLSAFLLFKKYTVLSFSLRAVLIFLILFSAVFIWSRFIEPQIITVKKIKLSQNPEIKVAVFSDTHIGAYKSPGFLKRVVDKVNNLKVDLILLPGDFIYFSNDTKSDLAPLKNLKAKSIAVFGNHDIVQSGLRKKEEVKEALKNAGVEILENQETSFKDWKIYALGEIWEDKADLEILKSLNSKKAIILLHNPDITLKYKDLDLDLKNTITIAGHTHCGQIRIPFIYKHVIPTKGDFPHGGLYDLNENGKLVISCGTGEIGLPMRLFNPPQILLLEI